MISVFQKENITPIIQFNRNTLHNVENWIKLEDYQSPPSLYNYGLPPHVYHLINVDVSIELTECDIICYYISLFNQKNIPIHYLEIGVSVGKTLHQIIEYLYNHTNRFSVNGLDIEKINPILNDLINKNPNIYIEDILNAFNDETISNFYKEKNKISKWLYPNGNEILYYEANEFDKTIWKTMKKKYNIIFSDAMHEPNALLNEYEQLKNNNLIDYDQFIYCFDDLETQQNGPMWSSVIKIQEDLQLTTQQPIYLKHYVVNGWLGNNEFAHNFGVLSNINDL
jgi:hypothetical protein